MENKINFNIKECFKNSNVKQKKKAVQDIINKLIKNLLQH